MSQEIRTQYVHIYITDIYEVFPLPDIGRPCPSPNGMLHTAFYPYTKILYISVPVYTVHIVHMYVVYIYSTCVNSFLNTLLDGITIEYTELWPCPRFDILLNKYFTTG